MKQAVGLYEEAQIYKKTCKIPEKNSPNSLFSSPLRSPNSQQLFLNPNLGVKWRGKDYENIDIVMAESTGKFYCVFAQSTFS